MRHLACFWVLTCCSLSTAQSYYLHLDDIRGESQADGYEGWLDVDSFDVGFFRVLADGAGGGRERGAATNTDFTVQAQLSTASPQLVHAVLAGKVFPELTFHEVTDAGGTREPFAMWELGNVLVTEVSRIGPITDQYAFNYETLKYTYVTLGKDGKPAGRTEVTWDFEEGTAVNPVDLTELADFDFDDALTATDLDILSVAIRNGATSDQFDLNFDGSVDGEDRAFWVENIYGSLMGDADLNFSVEFRDFLLLSGNFGEVGGWENGDFDGNGVTDFADFLQLSANFGQSAAPPAVANVPEPEATWILAWGAVMIMTRRKARTQR